VQGLRGRCNGWCKGQGVDIRVGARVGEHSVAASFKGQCKA
jgi:hypothetical protein